MSAKIIRFPSQAAILPATVNDSIATVAPQEIGFGITLSLLVLLKNRLSSYWRQNLAAAKFSDTVQPY